MSTEKTVTWSGTVSLPDGDTIGLVVSGPATTPEEGLDIAAYAAGQLIGLSRQADDDTGARIRRYVAATFGVRVEDLPDTPVETLSLPVDPITAEKQDAAAAQAEEVLAIESRVAGATERPHPDAKPEQAKAPAPQPAPSAPPTSPAPNKEPAKVAPPVAAPPPVMGPAPTAAEQAAAAVAQCIKPPAPEDPKPAPAGSPLTQTVGPICEACGAVVTKSQEKLSQLFMSKTLCKKCMEAP